MRILPVVLAAAIWVVAGVSSLVHAISPAPHPAVVRIIAIERGGMSMGSGALVAVDERHGMVVTNWHVVRDAAGPITVAFPDGFRSGATILKLDRDWDLAALAIQRPQAQPLLLATEPPQRGELLTIAGYGPEGVYRALTGRCTEYLSPKENLPAELVEVNVQARSGDSGGPICNSRGEIAGVLFGAGGNLWTGGYTMGAYCGRVRHFLAAAYVDFQRLPGNPAMIAQNPATLSPPPQVSLDPPIAPYSRGASPSRSPRSPSPEVSPLPQTVPEETVVVAPRHRLRGSGPAIATRNPADAELPRNQSDTTQPTETTNGVVAQVPPGSAVPQAGVSESLGEQVKTFLAIVGVVAILLHGFRLVASAAG